MNAITKISILKDGELFRRQALIDGVWQDARTKATVEVVDPASLNALGTVPDMGRVETRAAIEVRKRSGNIHASSLRASSDQTSGYFEQLGQPGTHERLPCAAAAFSGRQAALLSRRTRNIDGRS